MPRIQFRRDSQTNWENTNPVLAQGELGLVISGADTGNFKIGDGVTSWNFLDYGGIQGPPGVYAGETMGDGSDGDLDLNTGIVTLPKDMYYNNVTISGTGSIRVNGYRIFVKGTLNLDNAPVNAITSFAANGSNATGSAGATGGTAINNATIAGNFGGTAGGTGTTTTGGASSTPSFGNNGGSTGPCGAGGTGVSAGGGTGGAISASGPVTFRRFETQLLRGASLLTGGNGGRGGSAGGGDGTQLGRGGGAGGNAGGVIYIAANRISRGPSTAQGAISANGGNGGNGATATAGTAVGGGGGGSGGSGGFVYIAYNSLLGSAALNMINAHGGSGGNGGNGFGTGATGGQGGAGSGGGRINTYCLVTGLGSEAVGTTYATQNPTATTTAGTVGTAGGTCDMTL